MTTTRRNILGTVYTQIDYSRVRPERITMGKYDGATIPIETISGVQTGGFLDGLEVLTPLTRTSTGLWTLWGQDAGVTTDGIDGFIWPEPIPTHTTGIATVISVLVAGSLHIDDIFKSAVEYMAVPSSVGGNANRRVDFLDAVAAGTLIRSTLIIEGFGENLI